MLVIFDLDDTLIETSKCLTPHYLMRAYVAMQIEGASLQELIEINETALSARDAIAEFCEKHQGNAATLKKGLAALGESLPEGVPVQLVPGALELLEQLQPLCQVALVTKGEPKHQRAKMEKAGIQPEKFSKLVVTLEPSKKFDYKRVAEELHVSPEDTVVCGDRVKADLSPAKELGMTTVHLRNGRGLFLDSPEEDVDLSIDALEELTEVFARYES